MDAVNTTKNKVYQILEAFVYGGLTDSFHALVKRLKLLHHCNEDGTAHTVLVYRNMQEQPAFTTWMKPSDSPLCPDFPEAYPERVAFSKVCSGCVIMIRNFCEAHSRFYQLYDEFPEKQLNRMVLGYIYA